jgi:hypothetical protein
MSRPPIHGDAVMGERTRLYDIWRGIRQRCDNPKASGYADYGGRGIKVISDWYQYTVFRQWAIGCGYADNLSIERRDVDGDYTPQNCYWACNTIQACNKRKRDGKTSKFIGVASNKQNWQAYIDYKGVRTNLGTYSTPEEAALIRDNYVKEHDYPHKLNF